ncbi:MULTISPECIES: site-specific integrase [unclassified Streptomyces]|uniref:site-specific integrase n=2 Tax=unclassified Streptomyces TaxID=2593676 RepID=UPI00224D59A3|nr:MULTISPECIES: site-specific integrase [unclassified Streptomyces]MCX4398156.1 site-specific integrase [Streptomyces sp. NBC_01767]MCX5099144.1 site-specific integrase [Streptomyces sp. NBC_00439]WSC31662.1 site-specific integrase [Streptomyces sp. NBC_01768]WSP50478.1 site-specific integrase [Streptomyces sp. NBC_01243]
MTMPLPRSGGEADRWGSPIRDQCYDRLPLMFASESRAISELGLSNLRRLGGFDAMSPSWEALARLLEPLETIDASFDVPSSTEPMARSRADAIAVLLLRCRDTGRPYWNWSSDEWGLLVGQSETDFRRRVPGWAERSTRSFLIAYAYHLGPVGIVTSAGRLNRAMLAARVFGHDLVDQGVGHIRAVLSQWGYQYGRDDSKGITSVVCQLFLINRSPHVEDFTTALFERVRSEDLLTPGIRALVYPVQRAVAFLGFCDGPPRVVTSSVMKTTDVPPVWGEWVERWYNTSTLTPKVRRTYRAQLLMAGRWLVERHPEAADPREWTRQVCADWVAAVDRMQVGEYAVRTASLGDRIGQPLGASTKDGYIATVRTFFRDCQEWEWLPLRFDPQRALGTPRSIRDVIGPDPRVISDDIWAKLLWAGLNLESADLFVSGSGHYYPMELVRAITMTWLFAGLRSNEIARLRAGCIRWQHQGKPIPGDSQQVLTEDAVCLLDVPAHKTGTAFTKPVDPLPGQAISAWQAVRPEQPKAADRRTGEQVDFLFSIRARAISSTYINGTIIPMLRQKAGVPASDVRGVITSHRARSTITSQLYNAKEPMTLSCKPGSGTARPNQRSTTRRSAQTR